MTQEPERCRSLVSMRRIAEPQNRRENPPFVSTRILHLAFIAAIFPFLKQRRSMPFQKHPSFPAPIVFPHATQKPETSPPTSAFSQAFAQPLPPLIIYRSSIDLPNLHPLTPSLSGNPNGVCPPWRASRTAILSATKRPARTKRYKTHFIVSHSNQIPLEDFRAFAISHRTKLTNFASPCGTPGFVDKMHCAVPIPIASTTRSSFHPAHATSAPQPLRQFTPSPARLLIASPYNGLR